MKSLFFLVALFALAFGQNQPSFQIPDGIGADSANFGYSVDLSGPLVVIGAPAYTGAYSSQGAALVFTCTQASCTLIATLTASDATDYDNFGSAVSISGNLVVVGAEAKMVGNNEIQGAAYVFQCSAAGCSQVTRLTHSNGMAFAAFGGSVSVDGTLIAVGAPQQNGGVGAVVLFQCDSNSAPTNCAEVATLNCPTCEAGDIFAHALDLSGSTLIVSAPFAAVGGVELQGSVFVYDCTNPSACTLSTTIDGNGGAYSFFGWDVAVEGSRAYASSPFLNGTYESQGSVSTFDCSSGSCVWKADLVAPDAAFDDNFGYSIAASATSLVIGAPGRPFQTVLRSGQAYLYDCTVLNSCRVVKQWTAPQFSNEGDESGFAVGISGSAGVLGAPNRKLGTTSRHGAAFFVGIPVPRCELVTENNAVWPRTDLTATSYGVCQSGYVGNPSRYCNLDGTFGPISNPCIPASSTCPSEQYAFATWPSTSRNTVANGVCISGYSGAPTRNCLNLAVWSTNMGGSVCRRNTCPSVTEVDSTWATTNSLTTVTGTCLAGFVGTPTRTCQADGSWGPISNPCTSASCAPETYARAQWASTPVGTVATGVCVTNFQGSPQRSCTASGWSTNVVSPCTAIVCPATTAFGANFPATNAGQAAYGSCISGITPPTGRPLMKCDSTGQWVHVRNSC